MAEKSFSGQALIDKIKAEFGGEEVTSLQFEKLQDGTRKGKVFVGVITKTLHEEQPEGFEKPAQICNFTEFESPDFKTQKGEVAIACPVDLACKLAKLKEGAKVCIVATGEKKKIKGRPEPMILFTVLEM